MARRMYALYRVPSSYLLTIPVCYHNTVFKDYLFKVTLKISNLDMCDVLELLSHKRYMLRPIFVRNTYMKSYMILQLTSRP